MPNPPKPTKLKILQGNPGKRKLNDTEPEVQPGVPDKPSFLLPIASAAWDMIVPILLDMQVLTRADGLALSNLCMCYARWQQAELEISKHGVTVETPILNRQKKVIGQKLVKNPACTVAMACQKEMRAQMSAFGLDPSSRSRIKGATKEPQKSPLLQLLEEQQKRRQQARG